MSVTYNSTLKNTRMTDVLNAIDNGGGGTLKIFTGPGGTNLAVFDLASPCGTVSGGVLTFSGTPIGTTIAATGTATYAQIFDGTGTLVVDGLTVGTSSADVIVNIAGFVAGQTAQLVSASITHG